MFAQTVKGVGSISVLGGSLSVRKLAEYGHLNPVFLTPPSALVEPERMALMTRASWPSSVNEEIVNILLRVLDYTFDVRFRLVDEFSQTSCVR
jgi:hypothetical protein